MSSTWRTITDLIRIVTIALVAAAVLQELGKPPEKRTWHGRIASLIPYDLRLPTMARIRQRMWNPDDHRIITERVFGVGWTINFHALLQAPQREDEGPDLPAPKDS